MVKAVVAAPDNLMMEGTSKVVVDLPSTDKLSYKQKKANNLLQYRASLGYKIVGFSTMLTYLVGGFYLSRTRVRFLDDFTASITPNFVSFYSEMFITYLNKNFTHFQLATIWSMAVHQIVYWGLCLPDMMYQFFPTLNPLKIQRLKFVPLKTQWECFKLVCFNQWVIECPLFIFNYIFAEMMNYGFDYATLPTWYQLLAMQIGCLALEDTWHFFFHYLIHNNREFYQKVHKLHHRFTTPIGMQAEYAHPVEIMLLGVGFALGCGVYCNHFFATWLWMVVRQMETIEVHSGYVIPILGNVFELLPFYGGSRFHDFHHSNFVGNYSSTFTYWDSIFETDLQFRAHEKERKATKQ